MIPGTERIGNGYSVPEQRVFFFSILFIVSFRPLETIDDAIMLARRRSHGLA